jgi:solute carrier family 25 carnitine/acylcarnitine transporter 20/29
MPTTTPSLSSAVPVPQDVKREPATTPNATLTQIRSFVAGGVGGFCAVIVGHPFDLVKVRLQTAEKGVYSGAIDVVNKTIAREGLARVGVQEPHSR